MTPGAPLLVSPPYLCWDKPPGLPTTGRTLDDPDCLQFHLFRRFRGMLWAAHQLDADTSGVVLFLTRKRSVAPTKQRMRSARKRYLAVVHGVPAWDQRDVEAPIGEISPRTLGVTAAGQPARSRFVVRSRGAGHALVEGELFTGRTHQLRIHLQHLGHPLVGEEWYRPAPCALHPRQALHAWQLCFTDGAAPGAVTAPLPEDLRGLCAKLGLVLPEAMTSAERA